MALPTEEQVVFSESEGEDYTPVGVAVGEATPVDQGQFQRTSTSSSAAAAARVDSDDEEHTAENAELQRVLETAEKFCVQKQLEPLNSIYAFMQSVPLKYRDEVAGVLTNKLMAGKLLHIDFNDVTSGIWSVFSTGEVIVAPFVSLQGREKVGKTWLCSRLSGLAQGALSDVHKTSGIEVYCGPDQKMLIFDTSGTDAPVPMKAFDKQEATERFARELVAREADVRIYMVNALKRQDQIDLVNLKNRVDMEKRRTASAVKVDSQQKAPVVLVVNLRQLVTEASVNAEINRTMELFQAEPQDQGSWFFSKTFNFHIYFTADNASEFGRSLNQRTVDHLRQRIGCQSARSSSVILTEICEQAGELLREVLDFGMDEKTPVFEISRKFDLNSGHHEQSIKSVRRKLTYKPLAGSFQSLSVEGRNENGEFALSRYAHIGGVSVRTSSFEEQAFLPATDFEALENHCVMTLDMPGLKIEDIKVNRQGRSVIVTASRQRIEKKPNSAGPGFLNERPFGNVTYQFVMPDSLNVLHVDKQMCNGVLTLRTSDVPPLLCCGELRPARCCLGTLKLLFILVALVSIAWSLVQLRSGMRADATQIFEL